MVSFPRSSSRTAHGAVRHLSDAQLHTHSHSHWIFGEPSRSHSHGYFGHYTTLQREVRTCLIHVFVTGGRASRVTLVGLCTNVVLTSAKGTAGWYMNSVALLTDTGNPSSGTYALQPVALAGAHPLSPPRYTCPITADMRIL